MSKRELRKLVHAIQTRIGATGVKGNKRVRLLLLLCFLIVAPLAILVSQLQTQQSAAELPPPFYTCAPCRADVNKDGTINEKDKTIALHCKEKYPDGLCVDVDLNGDNTVDETDTRCILYQTGRVCQKYQYQSPQ